MNIEDLGPAIAERNWYLVIALALYLAMRVWERLAPTYYYKMPEGTRWIPAVLIAGAGALIDGYASGIPMSAAGWRVAYAVILTGLAMLPGAPRPWTQMQKAEMGMKEAETQMDKAEVQLQKAETQMEEAEKTPLKQPPILPLLGLSALFLFVACSAGFRDVQPVLSVTDKAAQMLCGVFHSKRSGISVQEAIDKSCDTLEKWRPFYGPVIAVEKAGAGKGDPEETGLCLPPESSTFEPTTVYILVRPNDAGTDGD